MARAGPSKVARKPSPVRLTSLPRWRSSACRKSASWRSSRKRQPRSPISAARLVESHDVREHHRREHSVGLALVPRAGQELLDLAQQAVRVAEREHVVPALQLHVPSARNLRRDVAGVLDLQEAVLGPVHHERRHPDRGQHVAHVEARRSGRRCGGWSTGLAASRSSRPAHSMNAGSLRWLGATEPAPSSPRPSARAARPCSASRVSAGQAHS